MNGDVDPGTEPASSFTGAETVVKQYVDDLTLALAQLETGTMTDLLETLILALHKGSSTGGGSGRTLTRTSTGHTAADRS